MLERWGRFVVGHAQVILAVSLLGAVLAGWAASGIGDRLGLRLLVDPGSEAYRGQKILEERFKVGVPNLVLLVTARSGDVDGPAVVTAAAAVESRLAREEGVADVASYWSLDGPGHLRSRGGNRALIVGRIVGDDKEINGHLERLVPRFETARAPGSTDVIDVRLGGSSDAFREMLDISLDELRKAELFTAPVLLLALVVVFGSVVAATLPLLVAAGAVLGTFFGLWVLAGVMEVSAFALTLTSALALGLAVDYSLFIIGRFREELAAGSAAGEAVVRTMQTAGRTVLFSAGAVAISLTGLVMMPLDFLRGFGYGGLFTALMAGVAALVVLPAALALLGSRVNKLTVWRRATQPGADGSGFWYGLACRVMRRPALVGAVGIAGLLAVASPMLSFRAGLLDDRELPESTRSRITGTILRTEFDSESAVPLSIVLPRTDATTAARALDAYAARLAALPHVQLVEGPTGRYAAGKRLEGAGPSSARFRSGPSSFLSVVTDVVPLSGVSNRLVESIRALPSPFPEVLVTGDGANHRDITRSVLAAVPRAFGFVALAMGLALFLQFGSVLVPLKAIVLNWLTLAALFGFLTWGFQNGHLSGLLGFTATGVSYVNVPVFIAGIAFGLSMDYELFLLSRIKEEYDRTGDNEAAIALGLQRSGRIVSAAAALIAVVFLTVGLVASMTTSKAFGTGLALVVLLDAFVIRGTLVPAFMKLAGAANWWAPRPLRRLHARIGVSEHVELEPVEGALATTTPISRAMPLSPWSSPRRR